MLESFLFQMEDHRRKQGRRYELGHILLFTILAILSGATSYRKVHTFIVAHYDELNDNFDLSWKRMPAYTTIRDIVQSTSGSELERVFREYSQSLIDTETEKKFISCSLRCPQIKAVLDIMSENITDLFIKFLKLTCFDEFCRHQS